LRVFDNISLTVIYRTFLKQKRIFLSMHFKNLLFLLLLVPGIFGTAFAHTIDSVGEYRLEIGWMNEPVVSGETWNRIFSQSS